MENGRHKLEIHIKFADDWLTMAEMDNIHNEELLSAIKFLSKRLVDGMEPFYRGEGLGNMKAGKLDDNGMNGIDSILTFKKFCAKNITSL
jgi:hypothetical protein